MLHVTNGDSAANLLRRTGITGDIIAWRDILHEGPAPAGLALEAMSDARARFLASIGAGSLPLLLRKFGARDAALRSAPQVVLWFEHDLYDQLHLIQILATLAHQRETAAELICIDAFPGVEPFHGLSQLTTVQLASLWPARRRVGSVQLLLAARAWTAFCSADPLALRHFVTTNLSALPFLRHALVRFLEEFPSAPDGLPRTERQILRAVAAGNQTSDAIFRANEAQETAPFMGDTVVQLRIAGLTTARTPLLTREPIMLTSAGSRVLAGEVDARMLNGIDRWFGGIHLTA
jgi:hypothetical protein